MKKAILYFVFSIGLVIVHAQSIEFRMDSLGTSINEDTLHVYGNPSDNEINEELWVKHNSTLSMDIGAKIYEEYIGADIMHYICWDLCFLPQNAGVNNPFISGIVTVSPDTSVDNFSAHYMPQGRSASSLFRYVLYDVNSTEDSSFIFIEFSTIPVSVNEIKKENVQLNAFPNPVVSELTIRYSIKTDYQAASVVLYDVLAQKVMSRKLDDLKGQVELSVKSLDAGIYYYAIQVDGETLKTEKLIVQ